MSERSNYLQTFLDYLSYEADASPLTVSTYQADLQSYLAYVEERLGDIARNEDLSRYVL